MPSEIDFPTRGKITTVKENTVTFIPQGTNYELHLQLPGPAYDGPLNKPVNCFIRCSARKMWTVPSGGNFIAPIFGPPRIIQGLVRHMTDSILIVHAAANFIIEIPRGASAVDPTRGPVAIGQMINCTVQPGATIEFTKVLTSAR